MKYQDFLTRTSFEKEDLLAFAHGHLIQDAPGQMGRLPLPPLLMMDRVTWVEKRGRRGHIPAVHWDVTAWNLMDKSVPITGSYATKLKSAGLVRSEKPEP